MEGKNSSSIKKIVMFAAIVGIVILLGGCWDRIETNDLAIVTAAGIDKSNDGQVEVSLEIFIPKSMSGGSQAEQGGRGGGETTLIIFHKGRNLAEALSKLQAEMPRKVFWGSCKIFIFGENIAKDGIQDHVDFLLRHPAPRERAFVFVSQGKARKFLEVKTALERYSAEAIREVADQGHGVGVTLQDLDKMMAATDQGAVLPYLKIKKEKSAGKPSEYAVMAGTALFKKDQMAGTISESTTRGLLWLRDKMKEYTVTVHPKGVNGIVNMFPVSTKVDLTPKIQDGEWKIIASIHTEGTVVQNTTNLNLNNRKSIKKVEEAYREKVKGRIWRAIEQAQEMNVDVVHFGKEFSRHYPDEWKKVEKNWEEVFPEVKVDFRIDAHIRRQGYINKPVKSKER